MAKKSLNRKAATAFIIDSRDKGISDKEIYDQLKEEYYDKKVIALTITGTPTKADKEKYRLSNSILLALLLITAVIKVVYIILLSMVLKEIWLNVLILVAPLLNVLFFYEIYKYSASIYRLCGLMTIISLVNMITKPSDNMDINIASALLGIAVIVLCFYLDRNLFPNFSPYNMRKDNNGDYLV